jgi:hypothetical protein
LPWFAYVNNVGTGTVTLTPASGTINGGASVSLTTGEWAMVFFDGIDFIALIYVPGSGSGVSSLNGLTGALSVTSPDGSIAIAASGSDVEIEVNQGGAVTTANFVLGAGAGSGASIVSASGKDGSHIVTIDTGSEIPSIGIVFTFTPTGGSRNVSPIFNLYPGTSASNAMPYITSSGSSYQVNQIGLSSSTGYTFTIYWPS